MQKADVIRALIADRLKPAFDIVGVVPASATGPFTEGAILSAAQGLTPRTILMRCDDHRKACIASGKVIDCLTLAQPTLHDPRPAADASLDATLASAAKQA